jgi:cytochrome c peroxidase
VAISPDGHTLALAAVGNSWMQIKSSVVTVPVAQLGGVTDCLQPAPVWVVGEATAVAYAPGGKLLVQTRQPARLYIDGTPMDLAVDSREDTGHAVFHSNAGSGIACASCHAEGGDDGRVWHFDIGPRRTQVIRGGILGTEPFHWGGEMLDFDTLFGHVYIERMGGQMLAQDKRDAVKQWVNALPALPAPPAADPSAVQRGDAIFHDPNGPGCAGCHAGALLTNNATLDVGTGMPVQVPSLRGVGYRAPFLHDGCAPTLRDRFGACGGGDRHGLTSTLTAAEIDDLVAYLESL